jgi:hypothetical protein
LCFRCNFTVFTAGVVCHEIAEAHKNTRKVSPSDARFSLIVRCSKISRLKVAHSHVIRHLTNLGLSTVGPHAYRFGSEVHNGHGISKALNPNPQMRGLFTQCRY